MLRAVIHGFTETRINNLNSAFFNAVNSIQDGQGQSLSEVRNLSGKSRKIKHTTVFDIRGFVLTDQS